VARVTPGHIHERVLPGHKQVNMRWPERFGITNSLPSAPYA